MAFQAQGEADEVMSEINVTPLVDVMLVLLVVFIVTAPLLTNAVKVHLPQTAMTAPPEQKSAVTVSIDGEGKIYLDKIQTALSAVEPEESSSYGLVAKVMSAVDRAGISKLSVLTLNE